MNLFGCKMNYFVIDAVKPTIYRTGPTIHKINPVIYGA
jgi:hypothetical protein